MPALLSLDTHAHIDARRHRMPPGLDGVGMVLAQTVNLEEAGHAVDRAEGGIVWGVGCHPAFADAQERFTLRRFRALLERTPVVGEIGLDGDADVATSVQRATLRAILREVADRPRIVSIHSLRATEAVVDELERTPVVSPILHRWKGGPAETARAVELGCSFSVHADSARRAIWRAHVPLDRILVETDLEAYEPPHEIPRRVRRVERLLAAQYEISPDALRRVTWTNLARIVAATGVSGMLPEALARELATARSPQREGG